MLEELRTKNSTLIVMPTGCGKTVVFSHVIQQWQSGRVLVLAHREELIRQAASKILNVTGEHPAIEMADEKADAGMFHSDRVVVSSIQTQIAGSGSRRRMQKFRPDEFTLVIVDEAHHAVSPSYKAVLAHYQQNPACKVLGVTATPDRSDEAALGQVFESVAFVYDVVDAIHDGWLVPIVQQSVHVKDLDYSHIRTMAGDLNAKELAEVMENERMLHEVATPTIELAMWRKTLVFSPSVKHAEQIAEIFNRHDPDSARWVQGFTDKDERRQILRDYTDSRFQRLVNCNCFTEGFDEPTIEAVVIARPTKSRALYAQMIGRGTRPLPGVVDGLGSADERKAAIAASRKPNLIVFDFEGNSGKHKLVTAMDILGGNYDTEVVDLAIREARKAGQAGKPVDVMQALTQAQKDTEAEKIRQQHRRRNVKGKAEYETKVIDAFDVLDIAPARERDWDRSKELTPNMIGLLERNGISNPTALPYGQARQLVGEIVRRFKEKRATFKQARWLKKHGYNTQISFAEASATMTAWANNGWRRPAAPAAEAAPFEPTSTPQETAA